MTDPPSLPDPVTLPDAVDAATWERARADLLTAEKELTRARDAVAARRRRLPMTPFASDHVFTTPDGPRTLLDLFDGRGRLVVYQFMDRGPDHYCGGCTWFTDNVPASAARLLAEHDVTWLHVSDMPLEQMRRYWGERGWTVPAVSSRGTSFSTDTGAGEGFGFSVFVRDGDAIYRTYATTARGIEHLAFVTSVLDLTPSGRGEDWEDSPEGVPQVPWLMLPNMLTPTDVATGFGRFRRVPSPSAPATGA
jgi:predicted dithiol-disulfide oxidoreductase (DUF899 family)